MVAEPAVGYLKARRATRAGEGARRFGTSGCGLGSDAVKRGSRSDTERGGMLMACVRRETARPQGNMAHQCMDVIRGLGAAPG